MKLFFILIISGLLSSCSQLSDLGLKGVKEDRTSFQTIWSKNLDPIYESGNLPIGLNSPLIKDGILYVGNNSGMMQAYQINDGKLIWSKEDKGTYHGAPILVGEHIIYGTTQGRLYSRNAFTGELKYSVDLGASVESKVSYYQGRIFLQLRNHKLIALDAVTGKLLWGYKRSVPFLTTIQRVSVPMVFKNKLYVGFADGYVTCFTMEDGILLWERKISRGNKFIDVDVTPVIFKDNLVVNSLAGDIVVLNPKNGSLVRKIQKVSGRSAFVDENFIIFGTDTGEFVKYDNNFTMLISKKVSEKGITDITIWKGMYVYSTVDGHVGALSKDKLVEKSNIYLGHPSSAVFGNFTQEEGYLALFSSRNRLYIYR